MFEAGQTQLLCSLGREIKPRLTGDLSKLGCVCWDETLLKTYIKNTFIHLGAIIKKSKNDSSHSVPSS